MQRLRADRNEPYYFFAAQQQSVCVHTEYTQSHSKLNNDCQGRNNHNSASHTHILYHTKDQHQTQFIVVSRQIETKCETLYNTPDKG